MIIKENNIGMNSIGFINQENFILKLGLYPHLNITVNSEDTGLY